MKKLIPGPRDSVPISPDSSISDGGVARFHVKCALHILEFSDGKKPEWAGLLGFILVYFFPQEHFFPQRHYFSARFFFVRGVLLVSKSPFPIKMHILMLLCILSTINLHITSFFKAIDRHFSFGINEV